MISYDELATKGVGFLTFDKANNEVGSGWRDIIASLYNYFEHMYTVFGIFVSVERVVEKGGGLHLDYNIDISKTRFYYDTDIIHQTIMAYEKKSFYVCEDCGDKGLLRNIFGTKKTLCEKCYEETVSA